MRLPPAPSSTTRVWMVPAVSVTDLVAIPAAPETCTIQVPGRAVA